MATKFTTTEIAGLTRLIADNQGTSVRALARIGFTSFKTYNLEATRSKAAIYGKLRTMVGDRTPARLQTA